MSAMFLRTARRRVASPDPDLYIPTWIVDEEILAAKLDELDPETLARLTALRVERAVPRGTDGEPA